MGIYWSHVAKGQERTELYLSTNSLDILSKIINILTIWTVNHLAKQQALSILVYRLTVKSIVPLLVDKKIENSYFFVCQERRPFLPRDQVEIVTSPRAK